jgi:succinyl-diaminopimelate desuccinylase
MMESAQPAISLEEVTTLLQNLVRIDSCNPPGHEEPAAEFLAGVMEREGLDVTRMHIAPGRMNVLGRWRGTGAAPALLLNGHLDTVLVDKKQWQHDPHGGVIEDGILYGRGAVDMKGGVAAMVMACVALARAGVRLAGDVLFAGTAGEEVDCIGAQHLLTHDLGPVAGLVVGEPTQLRVAPAHKGALWLEIAASGKAAHGSMPEQGYNAIQAMHRIIEQLLRHEPVYTPHPLLDRPTINLGTIQGGSKVNIVADRCLLGVDLRSVPGQDHATLTRDVQQIVDTLKRDDPALQADVQVLIDRPPVTTAAEELLIQTALRVGEEIFGHAQTPKGMSYFTDASVLTPGLGVPTLILGPGDERLAHQVDERTELRSVLSAARFYVALAQAFLSSWVKVDNCKEH